MSSVSDTQHGNPAGRSPDEPLEIPEPIHNLPPRARTIGVVAWCSFLAAAGATMVLFAFVDPLAFLDGDVPRWWTSRRTVYALGFFFFWAVAATSAALATYMAHTDRSPPDGPAGKGAGSGR